MKPYKILIIEDDPVIQGEMETLLRGNGYTAVSVKDFSKVTDTFKAEEPHLILLDIKLPNESGFSIQTISAEIYAYIGFGTLTTQIGMTVP